ncbi:MAG: hypothetical protein OSJ70_02535 [Bacilli bacterium]|nr:hypothetical protein [Bacilli bacterium]
MKKIDNKYQQFGYSSIIDIAKECKKAQKRMKFTGPKYMAIFIIYFVILIAISIFANPLLIINSVSQFCVILACLHIFKTSSKNTIKLLCDRLAWIANGYEHKNFEYYNAPEVEIVPKNIKIGEDLEAINIVPIFKEGKYVIIKSLDHPCFIRVFDSADLEEAIVMEAIDEDIALLESEIPEYQEYIEVLKLQKKL